MRASPRKRKRLMVCCRWRQGVGGVRFHWKMSETAEVGCSDGCMSKMQCMSGQQGRVQTLEILWRLMFRSAARCFLPACGRTLINWFPNGSFHKNEQLMTHKDRQPPGMVRINGGCGLTDVRSDKGKEIGDQIRQECRKSKEHH